MHIIEQLNNWEVRLHVHLQELNNGDLKATLLWNLSQGNMTYVFFFLIYHNIIIIIVQNNFWHTLLMSFSYVSNTVFFMQLRCNDRQTHCYCVILHNFIHTISAKIIFRNWLTILASLHTTHLHEFVPLPCSSVDADSQLGFSRCQLKVLKFHGHSHIPSYL